MSDSDDPAFWAQEVPAIRARIESDNVEEVSLGLEQLKAWVDGCDEHLGEADLRAFGYEAGEGELESNALFDTLFDRFGTTLPNEAVSNLIDSLFMKNEDFMDCAATMRGIEFLLEDRKNEARVIKHIERGTSGYAPGHRFYENSLLDQLVDRILPTFSGESLLPFLAKVPRDFLDRQPGDEGYALLRVALENTDDQATKDALKGLVETLFAERWTDDDARSFYGPLFSPWMSKAARKKPKKQVFSDLLKNDDLGSLVEALTIARDLPSRTVQDEWTLLCKRIHMHGSKVPFETFLSLVQAQLLQGAPTAHKGTTTCTRHFVRCALHHHHKKMMNALMRFCQDHQDQAEGLDRLLAFSCKDPLPGNRDKLEKYSLSEGAAQQVVKRIETIRASMKREPA